MVLKSLDRMVSLWLVLKFYGLLGHMPIVWNICISVLLVTLLIALSSYELYLLTWLSCMCA